MCLVIIEPKSHCETAHNWNNGFRERHMCPGCSALDRAFRRCSLDIPLEYPPDISAVNFAYLPYVGIIRMDFLCLFEDEIDDHLSLGRVLSKTRKPIPGFATYIGRKPLAIRGGPESSGRTCERCGRFVYSPLGEQYVMRDALTGQPLYEGDRASLVVTKELASRIQRGRWKGIYVSDLPIRDEPLDGIEEFPENYY
jgi:hypothetical protein